MTDKLSKEEGIAKVYQFINGRDWKTEADLNKDGTIVQTEFRTYLLTNFNWNGLEKKDQNDIITNFWNSINTEKSGTVNAKGTKNSLALNSTEEKNLAKNIEISNVIRDYVDNITVPEGLNATYQTKFQDSMKASLLAKATDHFKTAEYDENKKADFQAQVKTYLAEVKEDSYRITSADYYKYQAIDDAKVEAKYGYNAKTDTQLNNLIEAYITTIKNNKSVTYAEIKKAIDTLVNDYLATAGLGDAQKSKDASTTTFRDVSGNEKTFDTAEKRIAYFVGSSNGLNELQKAVLTTDLKEAIDKAIEASSYKDLLSNQDAIPAINEAKSTFINKILSNGEDFNTVKGKMRTYAKDFVDKELKAIDDNIESIKEALKTAKTNAKATVKAYYDKGGTYKEAVIEIFGEDYEKTIDEKTSVADIDKLVQQLKDKAGIIKEPTTVKDKSQSIQDSLLNISQRTARMTYRVLDSGKIEFVQWDVNDTSGGIFSAKSDSTVNGYFDTIKAKLESTEGYQSELQEIFGNDSKKKENLFNIALFMTLSDSSVVSDAYNEMNLRKVVNALVQNYTKLLQKAAASDKIQDYIASYPNADLLAGRTTATEYEGRMQYIDDVNGTMTKTMNGYYKDNSTAGNDDWAVNQDDLKYSKKQNKSTWYYDSASGASGYIITFQNGDSSDNEKMNSALKTLLGDYIANYKTYIEPKRIIELFKQAEENAFKELQNVTSKNRPTDNHTRIYGYAENGTKQSTSGAQKDYADYDTYSGSWFSVQAVLLQVMFEMKALVDKEIFK